LNHSVAEASTHKSAKTHAGNVVVTLKPKINTFPKFIKEHFSVKFGDQFL